MSIAVIVLVLSQSDLAQIEPLEAGEDVFAVCASCSPRRWQGIVTVLTLSSDPSFAFLWVIISNAGSVDIYNL